jgi:nitrate reductase beta subunit
MKVRAQIGMVLNLDKCIGCHTCSVTCKNVWTSREGMEYAWFNNVETKPGIGYPKDWENQKRWNGGWKRKKNGKIVPKQGGRLVHTFLQVTEQVWHPMHLSRLRTLPICARTFMPLLPGPASA